MDNHASFMGGLESLHELDPAQNLEIDIDALRAKIATKMQAQGLEFNLASEQTQPGIKVAGDKPNNVVSLQSRRAASMRRNWLIGLSAAAAVAAVGFTGWNNLYPSSGQLSNPGSSSNTSTSPASPRIEAASANSVVPGAVERLSEVGTVDFVAVQDFSTTPTKAPAYRLSEGTEVSSGEVQKVADSLGIKGAVKKNDSGFTVKDSTGATLTVTVGELTSLDFSNPAAVRMECVPVTPGDGNIELPNPERPKTPSTRPSQDPQADVPQTTPSGTPNNNVPAEDPQQIELPQTKPTAPSRPVATPTETPTETVPPAVRPGAMSPRKSDAIPSENPETAELNTQAYSYYLANPQNVAALQNGELRTGRTLRTPEPSPQPSETAPAQTPNARVAPSATSSASEQAEAQATQSPSPNPTNCVMKVVGNAPSTERALEEVSKVATSLGATIVSSQVGATQKDGLTTVDVPVKMPGQKQAQTWRAVVSADGLASVRANLGKETKLGDYKVISQKQAVERLNDPEFGPIDVFDPAGKADTKIVGKVELVDVKLANAPVKQKDGTIISMPVYQLLDTQGRIWTVLAVADAAKE